MDWFRWRSLVSKPHRSVTIQTETLAAALTKGAKGAQKECELASRVAQETAVYLSFGVWSVGL